MYTSEFLNLLLKEHSEASGTEQEHLIAVVQAGLIA